MKLTKKDECSYSISNAIRTLAMVPVVGLEPTRYCYQRILSPSRLPFHHTGMVRGSEIIIHETAALDKSFLTWNKQKSTVRSMGGVRYGFPAGSARRVRRGRAGMAIRIN